MKAKICLIRIIFFCFCFSAASCGGGPDYARREYLILNYEVSPVQYSQPIDEDYPGDSDMRPQQQLAAPIASAEIVDWSRFSIQITASSQIYQTNRQSLPSFGLFSQANASSLGRPTAKQRLLTVSITSDNTYTDAYPAGAELSSLLGPIVNPFYGFIASFDHRNIHSTLPLNIKTMSDYSARGLEAPVYFKIKLLQAPQYSRQNFEIKITLDDGSVFKLRTGDIYFALPNS